MRTTTPGRRDTEWNWYCPRCRATKKYTRTALLAVRREVDNTILVAQPSEFETALAIFACETCAHDMEVHFEGTDQPDLQQVPALKNSDDYLLFCPWA